MNVPGPGVNSVLSSLTNLSNTTMSRGSMAVEDTQSENSQKWKKADPLFLVQDNIRTGQQTWKTLKEK